MFLFYSCWLLLTSLYYVSILFLLAEFASSLTMAFDQTEQAKKAIEAYLARLKQETTLLDTENGCQWVHKAVDKAAHEPKKIDKTQQPQTTSTVSNSTKTEPMPSRTIQKTQTNNHDSKAETSKTTQHSEATKKLTDDADDDGKLQPLKGNGSKTDTYEWTQSLQDVNVTIPLDKSISRKQISVDIDVQALKVEVAGRIMVDGKLHDRIESSDATWTIESDRNSRYISLYLPKENKMAWWSRVVVGEQEINTRKIVPENSKLEDLDPSMRATVEKMMYDQRQKQIGLPTSDEQKKMEALRQFQASHPELDFSRAKFQM